jgi:hypothetical protein
MREPESLEDQAAMEGFVLLPDVTEVTRFEVIDHRRESSPAGRVIVAYDVQVEFSLQDQERTLKVFLSDRRRNEDFRADR